MNLILLLFLLLFISKTRFAVLFSAPHWVVGAAFLGLVVMQISYRGHNSRYKRIVGQFSRETVEQQRRGDRLFGWYLVLSVFSLIAICLVAVVRLGLRS